jgi:uncharacterized protein YdeI (YjbR/CyaY-like superfamily)
MSEIEPVFFKTPSTFRKWLSKNHGKAKELLVRFYKVGSGKPSMTWSESVDEALCFGWIDGVRKSIDGESYTIRFSPRKPNSIWSTINLKKMKVLMEKGLVQEAGLNVYNRRNKAKTKLYTHEKDPVVLDTAYERKFKASKKAWEFFQAAAPSYRRVVINWIMSAKQEETRKNRLQKLIESSGVGKKL